MTPDQSQALHTFSSHLPEGARVLYAAAQSTHSAEETRTPEWLRAKGFDVEEIDPAKDLRFFSLKRESRETYDAVWAGRALVTYSIEDAQRILATFFQALRPKTGILFLAYLENREGESEGSSPTPNHAPPLHRYAPLGFESMVRQNGYKILLEGKRDHQGHWIAVLARRI